MKWIKANDRLPEPTSVFPKSIVARQLMVNGPAKLTILTVNQFLDAAKKAIDLWFLEWLDENPSPEAGQPAQPIKSKEEVEQKAIEILAKRYGHPFFNEFQIKSLRNTVLAMSDMFTYASQFQTGYSREQMEAAWMAGKNWGREQTFVDRDIQENNMFPDKETYLNSLTNK